MYYPLLRATAGQVVPFYAFIGATKEAAIGEERNIDVFLSKDNGEPLPSINAVVERGGEMHPGAYYVALTEAEVSSAVYLTISPICSTPGVVIEPIFAALRSDTISGSETNQMRQALGLGPSGEGSVWETPNAAGSLGLVQGLLGRNSVRDDYVYDEETGKVLISFNLYVYQEGYASAHTPVGQGVGPQAGCAGIISFEATHSSVNLIGFKGIHE